MVTTVQSNGGGCVLPLEALFQRLRDHPLDRNFEQLGDFVIRDPKDGLGEPMTAPGGVLFFGNFFSYSHVFSILTDDGDLIKALTALIHENQRRPDYRSQQTPRAYRVRWRNDEVSDAGEFLTRNAVEAYKRAEQKHAEGCRVAVDRPYLKPAPF